MKLHLPQKLRAVLIASITAAGMAMPQIYAEIAWSGGLQDTFGYTRVFYMNDGANATLTDTDDNRFLITSNVDGPNPATGEITSVVTKDGALMRISGGNFWGSDRILNPLLIDSVQAGNGSGTVSISTEQRDASRAASNTTVSILAVSGTVGSVENYGVLTLGANGTTINASGTLNNHNGATLTINGSYVFDTSDSTKYTLRAEGSVEWSDATHSQGFKKVSGSTYYAIKGATDGANIGSITDSTGTALTSETFGNLCNYYFTAGTAADFDYTKFYVKSETATLSHNGTGQIIVEKTGATVTVQNTKYRDTSGSKNLNIVVGDGGVLEVTHGDGSGYVTGDININGGGTFRVAGQNDAFGWGATTTKSITLQGSDDSHVATLDLQQTTGYSVTMNAALSLMGYASITGAKGFNTYDGSFYAEGVKNTIDSFQIRHAATFEVKEGGELTVGTMTRGNEGNKTLTKEGLGTMTFTTKAQANGLVINEGKIVISGGTENSLDSLVIGKAGTLEITGGTTTVGGSSNVISHTIAIGAGGILNLAGTYDVSGIESDGETKYVGGEGIHEGNGFKKSNGFVHVLDIAEGGQFSQAGASFNYDGLTYQLNASGAIDVYYEPNYSILYVNNGDGVSFNSAWGIAQEHTTDITSVVMAGDTNINLDKDGATFDLSLKGCATLKAAAGATTTIGSIAGWQDSTLTVTGAGTIALPGGERTLTGSTKLDVQGNASTGKLVLNSNEAALTVAAGATLTMGGNLTSTHGSVNINGTVKLNGDLDLSYDKKSDVNLLIGATGKVFTNGLWMHHSSSIILTEGGEITIGNQNTNLSIVGKQGRGSINYSPKSGDSHYSASDSGYVITNATVTATGKSVTLGNTLSNVDMVVNEGNQLTISGTIANSGTMIKSGEGSLVLDGSISFGEKAIQNNGSGSITFGENVHFDLRGMTPNENVYTLFSGSGSPVNLAGYGFDASYITVEGDANDYYWHFYENGTISYTTSEERTWRGTEQNHAWSNPVWASGTATESRFSFWDDAVFDESAWKEVCVNESVTARNVRVNAGSEYLFEVGANTALSAKKLSIAEGSTLTITGEGSISVSSQIEAQGALNIGADTVAAAVTVSDGQTITVTDADMTVNSLSGSGNLIVGEGGSATVNALRLYSGIMSVKCGGTLNLGANVIVNDLTVEHGTVTTQHSGSNGMVVDTLTLGEDGVFRVVGDRDVFGYGNGTTKNIVMHGSEGHIAELQLEQTFGSVTMSANLSLQGYAHISSTKDGFNTYGGSITAEGVDNSIDKFQLRQTATIEVKEGGELTVGEITYGQDGRHNLTKTGEGTLTFIDTANIQALDIQLGAIALSNANFSVFDSVSLGQGAKLVQEGVMDVMSRTSTIGGTLQTATLSSSEMRGKSGEGTLKNVSMSTVANYTIENMSISGSLIDVGAGTTMYLVNVDIKSDTYITDEAAWLDLVATQGWLDESNTQVVGEYTTDQVMTLYMSGETQQSITLAAGTEIVELTSAMFDTVTLTGTDLWLDMTALAEGLKGAAFSLVFTNGNVAQVDVEKLTVHAIMDEETFLKAYTLQSGGTADKLYFTLVTPSPVPEPSTSTLSLLALAALAARRRRK